MIDDRLTFFSEHALLMTILLTVFILSCWILNRLIDVFNLRRLTIPGFWFLSYCLMIFFPSVFVAFQHQGVYMETYLFAVASVLITVPFGIMIANKIFCFRTREIKDYYGQHVQKTVPNIHFTIRYLLFACFTLAFSVLYIWELPEIPIISLLFNPGEVVMIQALREDAHTFLDSRFTYVYYVLRGFLYPFLISIAFGCYLVCKKKKWFLTFLVMFGIGFFYATITTAKSFVAVIFFVLFLFYYIYKHGQVNYLYLMVSIGAIIAFPIVAANLLYGYDVPLLGIYIVDRLFYGPAEAVYYYFEVFPDQIAYLHGRSIGKLSWILGLDFFNAPEYISRYIYNFTIDYGSCNAAFIADANANFGLHGVLIEGVLVGFLLQAVQIFILRQPKTILSLALYAFLIVAFWILNSNSLQATLLSAGIIFALISYYMMLGKQFIKLDPLQEPFGNGHSADKMCSIVNRG